MQNDTSIKMIDTSLIIPNKYQPRKIFDEKALDNLAESIKNYGIINPILVRIKDDKYEIIAGERRYRAAKKLGLNEVPVIIKNADEQQMAELALIENLERQSLSPIEEAKSYEEIMRIGNQTQESLAKKLRKSQSSIANKIRLLSLPQEIQEALSHKKISERHARSLLSVETKDRQLELLNRIISEKLTVKETEEIIKKNEFDEQQEIDEEEIKKAISDIMKSLNIQEEDKKEEKEDDNMNNGNFFPSFDNNNNMTNNNTSLNMMNMQSMNQVPMEQSQEMVMPTMNQPIVDPTMIVPNSQPMEQMQQNQFGQPQVSVPMADEPLFNPNVVMPQAEPVMYNQPMIEPNPMGPAQMELTPQISPEIQQMPTPMFNNNSLFGPQPMEQPQQEQFSATPNFEMQPQVSVPMADEPLFNPNAIIPQNEPNMETPIETPIIVPQPFEVPVITEISEPTVSLNNIQTLQDFLNSNGYQFKIFGNENADCIIIEIPRN